MKMVIEMMGQTTEKRMQIEFISTDEFVPEEHLLRQIENAVDFNYIYGMVEDLYCSDNGRPGIDPVVLFKMVLIQHLYGIRSLRRTVEEISMNIAYRWFLGYGLHDTIPHFSTISTNFRNRFTVETADKIFRWILDDIANAGYLEPETVFIDGTHIRANANRNKKIKREIPVAAKRYAEELMEEVNADRQAHGKKPLNGDRNGTGKTKTVVESVTDPDSGLFVKGEHERQFAYEAHTACDRNGYILEVAITSGNVHDSVAFNDVYDNLSIEYPEMKTVVADSAYKTPYICKRIFDDARVLSTAYKRPMTMKGGHEWWKYVYDEYYDCVICPEYHVLKYSTTNRDGYREYRSDPKVCSCCPTRELCTKSKSNIKTVTRHVWSNYIERAEDARHTPKFKELYRQRKETIERVFADAKEKHGMRYTFYRGLESVTKWVRLKFAAMNLKKMAKRKWKEFFSQYSRLFSNWITVCF